MLQHWLEVCSMSVGNWAVNSVGARNCNIYVIYSQYCLTIWQPSLNWKYHKLSTYFRTKIDPKLGYNIKLQKEKRELISTQFYTFEYTVHIKKNIYKQYFHGSVLHLSSLFKVMVCKRCSYHSCVCCLVREQREHGVEGSVLWVIGNV